MMRGVFAPIPCLVATLAFAGCMGRVAPVAVAYAEPAPVRHDAAYHLDAGAVAIAGGISPRARRDRVTLTHTGASGPARFVVPSGPPLSPGDTVLVGERWF